LLSEDISAALIILCLILKRRNIYASIYFLQAHYLVAHPKPPPTGFSSVPQVDTVSPKEK
jgi:hypothetical protein